jgi:hypothetical protein
MLISLTNTIRMTVNWIAICDPYGKNLFFNSVNFEFPKAGSSYSGTVTHPIIPNVVMKTFFFLFHYSSSDTKDFSYKIDRNESSQGTDYTFTFVSTIEKIEFKTLSLPINKIYTKNIQF